MISKQYLHTKHAAGTKLQRCLKPFSLLNEIDFYTN